MTRRIDNFHIFGYDFHDLPLDFEPEDEFDFEFWMTVTIGDGNAGSDFQVHVWTPLSISRLDDRTNCFMIGQWLGPEKLIDAMNEFIADLVGDESCPDHALAKRWLWEYKI